MSSRQTPSTDMCASEGRKSFDPAGLCHYSASRTRAASQPATGNHVPWLRQWVLVSQIEPVPLGPLSGAAFDMAFGSAEGVTIGAGGNCVGRIPCAAWPPQVAAHQLRLQPETHAPAPRREPARDNCREDCDAEARPLGRPSAGERCKFACFPRQGRRAAQCRPSAPFLNNTATLLVIIWARSMPLHCAAPIVTGGRCAMSRKLSNLANDLQRLERVAERAERMSCRRVERKAQAARLAHSTVDAHVAPHGDADVIITHIG
jgi:hypothetical protein